MSWRRKGPGHQQPWYWPSLTEITRSPARKGLIHKLETHHFDGMTWKRFPHYWPFAGESIGHWWTPLTKGKSCGPLMFLFTLRSKTNNRVSDDSYCNHTLCLCSGLFSSPPTWNKCLATPIHGRPASWPKWQASPKPEKNTYKINTS